MLLRARAVALLPAPLLLELPDRGAQVALAAGGRCGRELEPPQVARTRVAEQPRLAPPPEVVHLARVRVRVRVGLGLAIYLSTPQKWSTFQRALWNCAQLPTPCSRWSTYLVRGRGRGRARDGAGVWVRVRVRATARTRWSKYQNIP